MMSSLSFPPNIGNRFSTLVINTADPYGKAKKKVKSKKVENKMQKTGPSEITSASVSSKPLKTKSEIPVKKNENENRGTAAETRYIGEPKTYENRRSYESYQTNQPKNSGGNRTVVSERPRTRNNNSQKVEDPKQNMERRRFEHNKPREGAPRRENESDGYGHANNNQDIPTQQYGRSRYRDSYIQKEEIDDITDTYDDSKSQRGRYNYRRVISQQRGRLYERHGQYGRVIQASEKRDGRGPYNWGSVDGQNDENIEKDLDEFETNEETEKTENSTTQIKEEDSIANEPPQPVEFTLEQYREMVRENKISPVYRGDKSNKGEIKSEKVTEQVYKTEKPLNDGERGRNFNNLRNRETGERTRGTGFSGRGGRGRGRFRDGDDTRGGGRSSYIQENSGKGRSDQVPTQESKAVVLDMQADFPAL